MNIGFDAKQAFQNGSGPGNYSRNTIELITHYYPDHHYYLYTPDNDSTIFARNLLRDPSVHIKSADNIINRLSGFYLQSGWIEKELIRDGIQVFHGLANELPYGIKKTGVKTIVTIHDLIFLRYPKLYRPLERYVFNLKSRHAVETADLIIAVSEQTKSDIVNFYNVRPEKVRVVYQGCNSIYYKDVPEERKNAVRMKFGLPRQFILSVGTVEERKNVLSLIKAIHEYKVDYPLVVVGAVKMKYFDSIKRYLAGNEINNVFFLEDVVLQDLHVIYRLASVFVYASVFEGFGIPILEALNSGIPVITSTGGCFREAGGSGSVYINPKNTEELADSINKVLHDNSLKIRMEEEGYKHAQNFRQDKIARNLFNIYSEIIR